MLLIVLIITGVAAVIALGVTVVKAWMSPTRDEVHTIVCECIDCHTVEAAKKSVGGLGARLEAVEAAAAEPEHAHQACYGCAQVFAIQAMQRVKMFRESLGNHYLRSRQMFPSMRAREVGMLDIVRTPMPDVFFCKTHMMPDVDVMVYLYAGKRRSYSAPDIIVEGGIDYFKVVPASAEHWELAGASLTVQPEPAVRVKRGRKSAADRLREATARGEDVTAETPSVTRTRQDKGGENPEPEA